MIVKRSVRVKMGYIYGKLTKSITELLSKLGDPEKLRKELWCHVFSCLRKQVRDWEIHTVKDNFTRKNIISQWLLFYNSWDLILIYDSFNNLSKKQNKNRDM